MATSGTKRTALEDLVFRQPNEIDEEIAALREEKERAKELKQYHKDAVRLYDVYQSYIEVGFTAEQAWEMITICLKK